MAAGPAGSLAAGSLPTFAPLGSTQSVIKGVRNRASVTPADIRSSIKEAAQGVQDFGVVNCPKIKTWQKLCKDHFERYYKEGDAHIQHGAAHAAHQHSHDENLIEERECVSAGCIFQVTDPKAHHCCVPCSKNKDHAQTCECKPMTEAETSMVGFVEGIPEEFKDIFAEAHDLQAVRLLSLGHNVDLTLEDVERLHVQLQTKKEPNANDTFDTEDSKMDLERLHMLLTHCLEPPASEIEVDALLAHFPWPEDKPRDWSDHQVSVAQLYNLLTKGPDLEKFLAIRHSRHKEVTRKYLVTHISEEVDKRDYFGTLPMTVVNLIIFIYVVMLHLRVYNRSQLEQSLEEYVNGRDPRETCDANVDDMDSYWEWINGAGLGGAFGSVHNSTYNSNWNHCKLASRNILLGDVQLHQTKFDGSKSKTWLLHSPSGAAYLAANPGEYLAAAQAAAASLKDNGGDHPDIHLNSLIYNTYNEDARAIAQVHVLVPLGLMGEVRSRINVDACLISGYDVWTMYVVDALFVLLTLWITMKETIDACRALRLGCDELWDYFEFWNIIDWIQIIFRFFTLFSWAICVVKMGDSSLTDMVDMESGVLKVDVMAFDQATLEHIYEAFEQLRWAYYSLQICFAVNTMVIVAKFFKAFNSNPRLKVVQGTFQQMAVDMFHFMIIFATIFLPFVLIGHILFGSDITEFGSLTASVCTGITVMMGEFGWYGDIHLTTISKSLNSGKLVFMLFLWYFVYMILIVQVLLNMILAIILEKYLDITNGMHEELDAPPIWTQMRRVYGRGDKLIPTRGFVPFKQMLLMLENDDDPAHPDGEVTASSLMNAFPKMDIYQSVWIMCWLEVKMRVENDRGGEDDDELHMNLENKAQEKIEELWAAIQGVGKDDSEMEAIREESSQEKEMSRLMKLLQEVQTGVAKLRRDQEKLQRKVDTLQVIMPSKGGQPSSRGGENTETDTSDKSASKIRPKTHKK